MYSASWQLSNYFHLEMSVDASVFHLCKWKCQLVARTHMCGFSIYLAQYNEFIVQHHVRYTMVAQGHTWKLKTAKKSMDELISVFVSTCHFAKVYTCIYTSRKPVITKGKLT